MSNKQEKPLQTAFLFLRSEDEKSLPSIEELQKIEVRPEFLAEMQALISRSTEKRECSETSNPVSPQVKPNLLQVAVAKIIEVLATFITKRSMQNIEIGRASCRERV